MSGTNCTAAAAVTAVICWLAAQNFEQEPAWLGIAALSFVVTIMEIREARKSRK